MSSELIKIFDLFNSFAPKTENLNANTDGGSVLLETTNENSNHSSPTISTLHSQKKTSDKDISNPQTQKNTSNEDASNPKSQKETLGRSTSNTQSQTKAPSVHYKAIPNSQFREKALSKSIPNLLPSKEIFSRPVSADTMRNLSSSQRSYANDKISSLRHDASEISYRATFPTRDVPSHNVLSPYDISSHAYYPPHNIA